jgi:hypothetical protein
MRFCILVIGISEVDVLCLEKRISESDLTYTKLEEEWRPNNYGRNQYAVCAFAASNILTRAYTQSEYY